MKIKENKEGNTLKITEDIDSLVKRLNGEEPELKPYKPSKFLEEEYLDAMNNWANLDMYGMPRDKSGIY